MNPKQLSAYGSYQWIGFVIGAVPQNQPKVSNPSTKKELSVAEKLKMLKQMLDDGLITENEFKNKKSRLLEDL